MSLIINTPASSASVSGSFALSGVKNHPTVLVLDGSTTLSSVALASQSFGASVNVSALGNGLHTFSVSDGIDSASVAVIINNTPSQPIKELTINSPALSASLSATFVVSGSAGSAWVNCAVWDSASGVKVGVDSTPVSGTYASSVNMGSLSGTRTLIVRGFSVPAGSPGGSQTAVTRVVLVTNNPGSVSTSTAPALVPYYGANGHYIQGGVYSSVPFSTQAALLTNLGLKTYRQDCYDANGMSVLAAVVVPGFSAFGVTVIPCFIPDPSAYGSPSAAEAAAYSLGVTAANKFVGVVAAIEFGNEWDLVCITDNFGTDGNIKSQYGQSITALYMAWMAGFTRGVRSVDTTGQLKIGMNGTYIHFGWLDMIINNTLPNGAASGYMIALDFVTWHYYNTGGDMQSVFGHSGTYNVFNSIAALTSLPVYFSEVGAGNNSSSSATITAYINSQMPEFASHSQVKGWGYYELIDFTDGGYGIYSWNGSTFTAKGFASTLSSFIAANPR